MIGGLESTSLKKKKKKNCEPNCTSTIQGSPFRELTKHPCSRYLSCGSKKESAKKMLRGLVTYSKDRENEVSKIV